MLRKNKKTRYVGLFGVPHFANAHPAKEVAVFTVAAAGTTLEKIFVLLIVLLCHKTKIDSKKWAEYDTIILGYPNWWASIPMPIATLLESYDFSGKTIMPFCSHGGGRFGQSLTAISKLAPKATLTEGLSIHYSGGSSLSKDVEKWLKKCGVSQK